MSFPLCRISYHGKVGEDCHGGPGCGLSDKVIKEVIKKQNLKIEFIMPRDVYYRCEDELLERRKQIKQKSMRLRIKQNRALRLAEIAGKLYKISKGIS